MTWLTSISPSSGLSKVLHALSAKLEPLKTSSFPFMAVTRMETSLQTLARRSPNVLLDSAPNRSLRAIPSRASSNLNLRRLSLSDSRLLASKWYEIRKLTFAVPWNRETLLCLIRITNKSILMQQWPSTPNVPLSEQQQHQLFVSRTLFVVGIAIFFILFWI